MRLNPAGLLSEFQHSKSYVVRPCLRKKILKKKSLQKGNVQFHVAIGPRACLICNSRPCKSEEVKPYISVRG